MPRSRWLGGTVYWHGGASLRVFWRPNWHVKGSRGVAYLRHVWHCVCLAFSLSIQLVCIFVSVCF